MDNRLFVESNRDNTHTYHLGVLRELRGEKTGKVYSTYVVAACSGRQLGGVWGQTVYKTEAPEHGIACRKCFPKPSLEEVL